MHEMTATHLRNAFGGESMAHMRYKIWAQKAVEEGFPNVGRLFTAVSYAEQRHATNHFNELRDVTGGFVCNSGGIFGVGTTADNLQGGIDGEMFEIKEMYPVYLNAARFQNEKGAERSFHYALSAEKIHAAMYERARQSVLEGHDVDLGPVRICENCGYTTEGDIPDKCPICNVGKDKFRTFD